MIRGRFVRDLAQGGWRHSDGFSEGRRGRDIVSFEHVAREGSMAEANAAGVASVEGGAALWLMATWRSSGLTSKR